MKRFQSSKKSSIITKQIEQQYLMYVKMRSKQTYLSGATACIFSIDFKPHPSARTETNG